MMLTNYNYGLGAPIGTDTGGVFLTPNLPGTGIAVTLPPSMGLTPEQEAAFLAATVPPAYPGGPWRTPAQKAIDDAALAAAPGTPVYNATLKLALANGADLSYAGVLAANAANAAAAAANSNSAVGDQAAAKAKADSDAALTALVTAKAASDAALAAANNSVVPPATDNTTMYLIAGAAAVGLFLMTQKK